MVSLWWHASAATIAAATLAPRVGMPRQQQLQQHWPRDGACRGSSSCSNTGLATVACRGSSSRRSTGFAVVVCRGSSNNNSNGLAALGFLISINVALMLSLPPGRRDNSNRCSNRHESLRSEVTGRTEVAPYLKLFLTVMAGLFRRHRRPAALLPRLHHLGGQSGRASRLLWRKRPHRPRARHRRQNLQQRRRPAVLFSPLHRWGGRPGRPLLQMKQRHRRQHRRPAVLFPWHRRQYLQQRRRPAVLFSPLHRWGGAARAPAPADETAASKAAPTASGTVPSATPLRGAVGARESSVERRHRTLYRRRHRRPAVLFPRLHHLGGQSGRASRLLERRHRTLYRRRHRRPAVLLPRLHHLGGQSGRVSRLLERRHRTWQRRRFHWRSATTTTTAAAVTTSAAAVTAVTTTAAAAVTATTAAATTTPPQPVL